MAARISPRSNASSASTSSSSSRRAYRNPSFSKDRDGFAVDRWGSDGRNNNFSAGKQQQHQQHNKGQWGQKSSYGKEGIQIRERNDGMERAWGNTGIQMRERNNGTERAWGNTGIQIREGNDGTERAWGNTGIQMRERNDGTERAWGNTGIQIRERNEEGDLSWRSHKQPLRSSQEGGRSKGIQQPNLTYEQIYPAVQAVRSHWNQATSCERYPAEGRSTVAYTQQVRWERPKQDQHAAAAINSNRSSSSSYQNQGNRGGFTSQRYGNKKDPCKPTEGSRCFPASSSQERGYASGISSYGSRAGKAGVQGPHAAISDWAYSAPVLERHEERMNNFPSLTTEVETRARTSQAVPASPSVTARVWGGSGAFTRRWADECEDDQWNISALENEAGTTFHKVDCRSSVIPEINTPNIPMYNHRGFVRSVADKTSWRQNWEGTTIEARIDSLACQEPHVRPLNASRNTIAMEQKGAIGEQRAGTSGQSQKISCNQSSRYPRGVDGGEVTATRPEVQSSSAQGDPEGLDDVALPFIMGTCEDMCPSQEREQRERLRDLAVFERLNGNPGKTSRDLAVKKFCRTFSSVKLLSSDVRPLRVLWSTLQYLLNLLDDSEFPFDVVHNFLFDRTRAIRQELGMQRIANSQAINMYEEIVRFHILSEHELSQRGSGRNVSDSHLNLQQLSKALLSLFDLYNLNRQEKLANEAEFRAYYVLLNLDSIHHYQADSLSLWFRQCPAGLLKTWEVKFARAVLRCYRSGNYRKFFLLAQEATFLQSCLLELHFNEVRLVCLAAMNQGGYKLHPIPLTDIAKQLLMKEGDLEELCNLCGLATGMDTLRMRCLLVKQSQFSRPKEIPRYRCACIVGKQPTSYYEEITGTNCTRKRAS